MSDYGPLQDAVREAAERGGRVTPALVAGLDRVLTYDPADMTVSVQAGCSLEALGSRVAKHGQWLPIDVAWPARTTVGGLIASGRTGPLRASFGTVRDHLIGLVWIGGDGAVLHSGGRVVKNVAGYDVMALHVGAGGRFGVLVEATFKVRPRPEREIVLDGTVADARTAVARALELRDLVEPAWCVVARSEPRAPWRLLVGLLGSERQVEVAASRVLATWPAERHDDGTSVRLEIARLATGLSGSSASQGVPPHDVGGVLASLARDDDVGAVVANVPCGIVTADRGDGHRVSDPRPAGVAALEDGLTRVLDPAGVFRPALPGSRELPER